VRRVSRKLDARCGFESFEKRVGTQDKRSHGIVTCSHCESVAEEPMGAVLGSRRENQVDREWLVSRLERLPTPH
jgi:hypothetical protein